MDINTNLNDKLLSQCFVGNEQSDDETERGKMMAAAYAAAENAVAVLSDLKEEVSYIYYGGIAKVLGIGEKGTIETIQSIWEKEIFKTIEPSDLEKRNLDELQFFHFIKNIPAEERGDYYLTTGIMMHTENGYIPVNHRISYIGHQDNDSIRYALCLYNIAHQYNTDSYIYNTLNGSRIVIDRQHLNKILSEREKGILRLIEQGHLSKEIANSLSISIHTVNRHRQNILEKLRVQNSFEACKTARLLNLL
ncbi:MAG: LuxR C-terminal-related transcriptional regulator [Fibrobacter sp.]|nr:LuxR C-terminal-related transcriptional regulator [Fibrobacter sp.]